MMVGERRRLVVPPALSRRSDYPAGLSPEDVLYYDVTLVAIEPGTDEIDKGQGNEEVTRGIKGQGRSGK